MMSPLSMYLWYAFGINTFRTVMYTFNLEGVTKVKVAKQSWEDLRIQEVMYAYTSMILKFMFFRAVVCLWAATQLEDGNARKILCSIIFAFDVYLMAQIYFQSLKTDKLVMRHQNIFIPGSIQASLCVAGLLALLSL